MNYQLNYMLLKASIEGKLEGCNDSLRDFARMGIEPTPSLIHRIELLEELLAETKIREVAA